MWLAVLLLAAPGASAIEKPGESYKKMGLTTQLGDQVDRELAFTDSNGERVSLAALTSLGRPLIITPVYYGCPRLCGLVLKGFAATLEELGLDIGKDFRIATVSFKPEEGPKLSKAAADKYHEKLNVPLDRRDGWRFMTGDTASIKSLMSQLGFNYLRDGEDYAHSGAVFILTPEGKISQYFTGIMFDPGDLRLALVEASGNMIGNVIDHVMLFCFRFDPLKGKYTWMAFSVMRIGGLLTLIALGTLIFFLWRGNRKVSVSSKTKVAKAAAELGKSV